MTHSPGRLSWRLLSGVLLVAAVVLAVMAFTRFDGTPEATDSPEEQRAFERDQVREAQQSMALGVAASFALLGTFACWQRAGRAAGDAGQSKPPQP